MLTHSDSTAEASREAGMLSRKLSPCSPPQEIEPRPENNMVGYMYITIHTFFREFRGAFAGFHLGGRGGPPLEDGLAMHV